MPRHPSPAGTFPPNPFGLYDTVGNVWEWVQDCWHGGYEGAPTDGSAWQQATGQDCGGRVVRGGSWSDDAALARSAFRYRLTPDYRVDLIGFRLARDL